MARDRINWKTKKNSYRLNEIMNVVNELSDFYPLTLRQVFYQLVTLGVLPNKDGYYQALSKLCKWGRLDGFISWEALEDRVRTYANYTGFENNGHFFHYETENYLQGYRRNFLNNQDVYIEIWLEKDALFSILKRVALEYGVSLVACRGFVSITVLKDYAERIKSIAPGKRAIMLYFGDFDPSGLAMLPAMQETLNNEIGVDGIEFKRIALTKEQIYNYNLPHDAKAVKDTDKRSKEFIKTYGRYAVELDALKPGILANIAREAIEKEINLDLYKKELEKWQDESETLRDVKEKIVNYINSEILN